MAGVSPDHVYIADISAYQMGFNIEQAHQDGLGAAVAKVTEGGPPGGESWDIANKSFARDMYNRATARGMLFGFYHYLRAGDGATQCDYFLDAVNRITGHGVNGHLVQLDYEHDDANFEIALQFANRFRAATGNHPLLVYTARWYWTQARLGSAYTQGTRISPYLWSAPNAPGGGSFYPGVHQGHDSPLWNGYGPWSNLTIMQYTNAGHTGGLLNVDLNCFRGPMSELRKLAGITDPPPTPTPTPPNPDTKILDAIKAVDTKVSRILQLIENQDIAEIIHRSTFAADDDTEAAA